MSRICLRVIGASLLLAWLLVPLTASAHERVESGSYVFVVGWVNEPVIAGQPNGLDLFIQPKEAGESTEGEGHDEAGGITEAEGTLTFSVAYGSANQTYELHPVFGEPGHYVADLIPTREGQYTFHLTGDVQGEAVDLEIEPEEVITAGTLAFPEAVPSNSDLAAQLAAAQAQTRTAQTIAIAGAVLGVIGIGLGAFAIMKRK